MREILPTALFQQRMTFDGRAQTGFLRGAIVCYILFIIFYVVMVGTHLGHQLDDDAFLGRGALNRHVIRLDTALLTWISDAKIIVAAGALANLTGSSSVTARFLPGTPSSVLLLPLSARRSPIGAQTARR